MRVDEFLSVMESFVGTTENPPGSNNTPIGEEYGFNGVSWCAETISVACNRLGFPLHEAAVIRIVEHAKAGDWGMGWSETPVVGSAVCFDWGGHGNWNDMHVGAVKEDLGGGRFRTIEGNYKDTCREVLRDMTYVMGFATFPFDDAAAPGGPTPMQPSSQAPVLKVGSTGGYVARLQTIINQHAGGALTVDGQFGPATEAEVQKVQTAYGLETDGVVGPQTWGVMERLAAGETFPGQAQPQPTQVVNHPFGPWPYQEKDLLRMGAQGDVVAYLQRVIAAKAGGYIDVDGRFGPQTESRVRTVQLNNGLDPDGIVGPQTWGVIDHLATS